MSQDNVETSVPMSCRFRARVSHKPLLSAPFWTIHGMAQNFLTCDRDQPLLLPPDLHDWLPEDHLAWFVIEAIEELDLDAFYASYRADGHGRAAHEPKMMLTLLTYAYAVGERSSRGSSAAAARTSPSA